MLNRHQIAVLLFSVLMLALLGSVVVASDSHDGLTTWHI